MLIFRIEWYLCNELFSSLEKALEISLVEYGEEHEECQKILLGRAQLQLEIGKIQEAFADRAHVLGLDEEAP